MGRYYSYFNKS